MRFFKSIACAEGAGGLIINLNGTKTYVPYSEAIQTIAEIRGWKIKQAISVIKLRVKEEGIELGVACFLEYEEALWSRCFTQSLIHEIKRQHQEAAKKQSRLGSILSRIATFFRKIRPKALPTF